MEAIADRRKDTLTFVTYNVGLLSFKLFGVFEVFANPPYANERFPKILDYLDKEINDNVDIVCIQECYSEYHAEAIKRKLQKKLPYHARHFNSPLHNISMKFHNGLLTLSKFPVAESSIMSLRRVSSLERWLANKSHLLARIVIPSVGEILLVHVHTTAGGTVNPENPDVDGDREDEFLQAWEACEKFLATPSTDESIPKIPIIMGDFNCGPEASVANFNYILGKGFRDTFAEYRRRTHGGKNQLIVSSNGKAAESTELGTTTNTTGSSNTDDTCTWDPNNYLNKIGPHAECPGQRCDHVIIPQKQMKNWTVSDARLLFQEPIVPLRNNIMCTLSDHYGLYVQITRSPSK